MTDRRALRKDGSGITVLQEQRVPLEADLQEAFVWHPEALPASDLNLGPLTSIGWELGFGAGPMDHLAVDTRGQLVIIEYKKGTENSDVGEVVAQLLDYGSALWRKSLDELENACRNNGSCSLLHEKVCIADHVADFTDDGIVRDDFVRTLELCLETGTFVFLYVVRDLDASARRVLTYLAEGAGLRFYAVEVDWFAGDDSSAILIPRVAYVPVKVAAGETPGLTRDPGVEDLTAWVEALARKHEVAGYKSDRGRRWGAPGLTVLGVYDSSSGATLWLPEIAGLVGQPAAEAVRAALQKLFSERQLPALYPSFAPSAYLERWEQGGGEVIDRLFADVAPDLSAAPAPTVPNPHP